MNDYFARRGAPGLLGVSRRLPLAMTAEGWAISDFAAIKFICRRREDITDASLPLPFCFR